LKFDLQSVLHSHSPIQVKLCSRCCHWLTARSINDTLVKVVPFLKQSFLLMINVTDPAVVH